MTIIIGSIMLLVGLGLTKAALSIIDAPQNPSWIWAVAFAVGVGAFVFIGEGTVLLLTGQWWIPGVWS